MISKKMLLCWFINVPECIGKPKYNGILCTTVRWGLFGDPCYSLVNQSHLAVEYHLPPSSCTTVSHRYATTIPIQLFGSTHKPSHLWLNLFLSPQMANAYFVSLSCPSQHQTSFGPSEVSVIHLICCAVGWWEMTESGSSIFWTAAMVRLIFN